MAAHKITERTFYAPMIDVTRSKGGQGVQEAQYDTVPDIIFQDSQTSFGFYL